MSTVGRSACRDRMFRTAPRQFLLLRHRFLGLIWSARWDQMPEARQSVREIEKSLLSFARAKGEEPRGVEDTYWPCVGRAARWRPPARAAGIGNCSALRRAVAALFRARGTLG